MGVLGPLLTAAVTRKLRKSGIAEIRLRERQGYASLDRPAGPLVWCHGASVGESVAALTLVHAIKARRPDMQILMTSGTATSARILADRMPDGCHHQFAPVDTPASVARFLDHWRPDAGIFVDSEIWPNMLVMAQAAGVKLALVNARLSRKSVDGWTKYPATSAFVLDQFDLIITQNRQNAQYMRDMHAPEDRLHSGVNLKSLAPPLPVDDMELARLRGQIGDRPIWVAASTHKGEEETVLAAHSRLKERVPDTLLVLVPRHPERGDEVAHLIGQITQRVARRSSGETPRGDTDILLADTLGEMGLWYNLSPIVFVGGSLQPVGGHNPFEVAHAGGVVLFGPHVTNFAETYEAMTRIGTATRAETSDEIAQVVLDYLDHPEKLATARTAAGNFVSRYADKLDEMIDQIMDALYLKDTS